MKNKNGSFKLIGGLVAGMILGGATIVCANQAIQAIQNTEIKVSLNGEVQTFKDETTGETQYPITYNDRTYLPLRNVAQLAGMSVDFDSDSNTALLTGINTVKGNMLNTETINVYEYDNIPYFYYQPTTGKEEFKKIEIKGLPSPFVKRAILFRGPQVIYSSTLVLLCDDGVYFAKWQDFDVADAIDGLLDSALTNTVYAKKIETKSDQIMSIMQTSYDTGDIYKGHENYVMVIYDDGTFEEIYVLNDRMAS